MWYIVRERYARVRKGRHSAGKRGGIAAILRKILATGFAAMAIQLFIIQMCIERSGKTKTKELILK